MIDALLFALILGVYIHTTNRRIKALNETINGPIFEAHRDLTEKFTDLVDGQNKINRMHNDTLVQHRNIINKLIAASPKGTVTHADVQVRDESSTQGDF